MDGKRSIGTPVQALLAAQAMAPANSSAQYAPLPLDLFLRVGTQIARALAEYHEQSGVHGRLSPANIVLFATEGYAEIKSAQATSPGTPTLEHWIYLAPEQTGRFERPVDVRSDLYVLGVILYELVVGALPFRATDALSWIHSHLAKLPRVPTVALPAMPRTVSDILMKLLAKGPEDRYQAARGLEHDLERCRADWEKAREISAFPLGERDDFDRFTIPQKVYGRDDEQAALRAALTKVIESGQPRVFLLAGDPGVGKTALVRELAKPVAAANGFFCTGKFDQYQRDVPYAPIVQAFRDLMTLILAASEERILAWRRRLHEAVGINGRLITDLLPEAELIIGAQPPVAPMPPLEAHRRFVHVFRRFMQVFANVEHPLVLFLDDLQWADAASLRLLGDVASQTSIHSLLFIGAYRDNEVGDDHSLHGLRRELEGAARPVDALLLGALGIEPLGQLVADTLHLTPRECAPLTSLIFAKTRGNPFFCTRFLAMLHRSGLVRFDRVLGWTWDTSSIAAHDFSDNVVDLMTRQLRHCPPETARALSLAACLGSSFDLEELAAVGERSQEQMVEALEQATEEGLVVRTMNRCRFVHDRIQQAAYARIPDVDRAATHLGIGRVLLSRAEEDELPDRVFDILSQLNRGIAVADDARERERLARLNLAAAKRARASAAFRAAADYAAAGLQLLSADTFARTHDLAFALCLECADCELACGNLEASEQCLGSAQTHAKTRADRAACWRVAINLHNARSQPMAALDAAFQCLRLYDLNLSPQPLPSEVEKAERAMFERLGQRFIEAVADLPLMEEGDIEAAINVLAGTLPSAYFVDLHLHRLIACHMVDLTLRHGLCALSPMGVAAYGMELAVSGKYEEAERFGQAALATVERHRFTACRAGVLQILGASLAVWTQGVPAAIELLRESARAGLESGEAVVAAISRMHVLILTLASGAPLEEVEREADRALDVARSAGYAAVDDAVHIPKRIVQALRRPSGQDLLAGPDFDAFSTRVLKHPLPLIWAWFHTHALPAYVIFGDTPRALAAAAAARPIMPFVRAQHAQSQRAFYSALAITSAWNDATAELRAERAGELRECDEQLRGWAATCPKSYLHLSLLVRAEIARTEARFDEAVATYERAILAARECGAVHVEALTHERAAAAFWTRGLAVAAELHLREARSSYVRWGALAKVEQLDRQWPDIAPREILSSLPAHLSGFDALGVVKASQAISSEIILERLLEKLLRVAIEEAGAEHSVLLLLRQGEFAIAATAAVSGESVDVSVRDPFVPLSGEVVPISVISYVRRTAEPLILADARRHDAFCSDPYVVRREAKSILAVPIVRQGKLEGVLYLGNDLVANAFTQTRLSILQVLAGQVAISLENATLYSDLRREIAERERTEEGLRASEAQLRQAQKMEAVGQLAGGIAHDFNNLLTGILGYSLLALERLPEDSRVRRDIEEIQNAGERAAALTRQLLAFSRRQVLNPRPLDLNSVVQNMEGLLRRLIDEDVHLVTVCAPNLHIVRADQGQIEQVLMNLAVNARDAMPRGGTLTIETKNRERDERHVNGQVTVRAGSYVLFEVSDTGEGMNEETKSRMFEPFFTTKEQGKGTGLGLSMVYGIVQQSGGHIEVESEIGRGTSFQIYLPAVAGPADPLSKVKAGTPIARGTETILLVEDEALVRNFTRELLTALGYRVLLATDGFEALRVQAQERCTFDLLITDVLMPHMNGPQLAKRLQQVLPDMGILFLSGYTADAALRQGLHVEAAFLQKPFSPDALARKTREVLDRRRAKG
jgi:predicted ATPase/signal transduction histidine kinase/ActR/RegA family two-component response regulator